LKLLNIINVCTYGQVLSKQHAEIADVARYKDANSIHNFTDFALICEKHDTTDIS